MTGRRLSRRAVALGVAVATGLGVIGVPIARGGDGAGVADPLECSSTLAAGAAPTRECVIAVASTYLAAEEGSGEALLADDVAVHRLGEAPDHAPGNAAAVAAELAASGVDHVADPQWTVDGIVAFVAYEVHTDGSGHPAHHNAARITLLDGLIHEVLVNPTSGSSAHEPNDHRAPSRDAVALAGPVLPAVDMAVADHDDPAYCTLVIAEQGDEALTPDQERRCLIAIASTYVDAEGNTEADTITLFDPRFAKYSLGGRPSHHPANGDLNRMDQTYLSPTIRHIANKQWTVDVTTDEVWIVYDGYLPVNVDRPGFYVAERFTIRDGLIWEIMISPVVTDVPGSFVPGGGPPEGL